MAKTERELTVLERRSIRKLVTGSCANYDNAPCWASATRTVPCAGTSGNRFCPTPRNWKQPCRRFPQNAASTVGRPSQSAVEECTAPTNVQTQPGKSRPLPGCTSTGKKLRCNALSPKSPCSVMTFRVGFRKVVRIYSPFPTCTANGYRAQNKNQEIRK